MQQLNYWRRSKTCCCGALVPAAARWCTVCGEPLWSHGEPSAICSQPIDFNSLKPHERLPLATPLDGLQPQIWGGCGGDVWLLSCRRARPQECVYHHLCIKPGCIDPQAMKLPGQADDSVGRISQLIEAPIATRYGLFLVTENNVTIWPSYSAQAAMPPRFWKSPTNHHICGATAMPDGRVVLAVTREHGAIFLFRGTGQGNAFVPVAILPYAAPADGCGVTMIAAVNADGQDVIGLVSRGCLHRLNIDTGELTGPDECDAEDKPLKFIDCCKMMQTVACSPRLVDPRGFAAVAMATSHGVSVMFGGFDRTGALPIGLTAIAGASKTEGVSLGLAASGGSDLSVWIHSNGSSRCCDRVSGNVLHTINGGGGMLLALDGQLIRLNFSGSLGWCIEGFGTGNADAVSEEKPKPLGVFGKQPFLPLLPPLAVAGYGLLVATMEGDQFGVIGLRNA